MGRNLSRISRIVTFRLPCYFFREVVQVLTGRRSKEIWAREPFRSLESPIVLPDGNIVFYPWKDGSFWAMQVIEEVYELQVYERLFQPEKGSTVVDVGAHIGLFTLKAAKRVGQNGRVMAVEPEDQNYKLLCRNVRTNGYSNVIPLKLALSDFEGKTRFYVKDISFQHSFRREIEWETKVVGFDEVVVQTLTRVLTNSGIKKVDFLKVDVEGTELEVLKGSEELLAAHKISKIAVAAYHTSKEAKQIQEYLENFDYNVHVIGVARIFGNENYLYAWA